MVPDAKPRVVDPGTSTLVVPLRPCLGAAALVFLALAMSSTRPSGFVCGYTPLTLVEVLAAALFAMTACFVSPRRWEFPAVFGRVPLLAACLVVAGQAGCRFLEPSGDPLSWAYLLLTVVALALAVGVVSARRPPASFGGPVLAALALFLSAEGFFYRDLNPPCGQSYLLAIDVASGAGFVLTASLLIHLGGSTVRRRWLFAAQVLLLFASGTVLRYASAVGPPDPDIDLWRAQQAAAEHILAGENPYAAEYPDKGAPYYPPLPLLVGVPFRALGRDVRLGNVVCDLVAALALFGAGRRGRGRLAGALLAAGYLNFPRVPLIMELAWYEPMLAATLGGGAWLVARGWRVGYFVLGLGLTGKQYVVVLLPALWKGLRGHRVALLLGIAVAGATVVLPFYLWGPRPFVERVIDFHLGHPLRDDGVTLQAAALARFGIELPRGPMLAGGLLLIGLVAWRTPSQGLSPAPWMATSLLVFCLFFTQAFLNYFYLCAYLMLLGLAGWFAHDETISPPV